SAGRALGVRAAVAACRSSLAGGGTASVLRAALAESSRGQARSCRALLVPGFALGPCRATHGAGGAAAALAARGDRRLRRQRRGAARLPRRAALAHRRTLRHGRSARPVGARVCLREAGWG